MIKDKFISISFMTEKQEGHGEDAPPLLIIKGSTCAVGVFDGMGGAGAAICKSEYGSSQTKAYVASRIVAESLQVYLETHLLTDDIEADSMKSVIINRLQLEQKHFPPETKSTLRSKLVREYPTTMAVITLHQSDNAIIIDSYWTGDSRCYLWTKNGFYQISKDDIEENNDPMRNLHNDSPLSNCISADRDFRINHKQISLPKEERIIILTATDGCFAYYPTPMHFEYVIKKCLNSARDEQDWAKKIEEQFQKVTGDDASLSLIAVGFSSLGTLKGWTKHPSKKMSKLLALEEEIASRKRQLEDKTIEYNHLAKCFWEEYRKEYLKHINFENNANA